MYTVTVKRRFTAFHYLLGGVPGRESRRHAHRYEMAAQFEGYVLDRNGYLIDIDRASEAIERIVRRYRQKTLNRLPEFSGLNPSIEHLARCFCQRLCVRVDSPLVHVITITIAENNNASASFRSCFHQRDGIPEQG